MLTRNALCRGICTTKQCWGVWCLQQIPRGNLFLNSSNLILLTGCPLARCVLQQCIAPLDLTHKELVVPSGSGAQSWWKALGWSHSLHFWFAFQKHLKWAQGHSRSHNLSSLPLLGELCLLMCAHVSVCPAGGFGKHGQAPLLSAAWLYRSEGFLQVGFHPRQAKTGPFGSFGLLSFKYQISTNGVRRDQNKCAWCLLLLLKHSSQMEAGEGRLTCWQHVNPYVLMLKNPMQDLKNLLFSYH